MKAPLSHESGSRAILAHDDRDKTMMAEKKTTLLERGADQFRELLKQAGGTLTQEATAARLGVDVADVQSLTDSHRLLGIELEGSVAYPCWQFDEAGVLTGLEAVLAELADVSTVLQVTFFLSSDERLGMERIEYLRTQKADNELLNQARQLGQQGAA